METVSVVRNSRIKTLHLFAGAGGGILADLLLGHDPVGAVEIEAYPRKVLLQRQIDGCLPEFPVWDDVRTFRSDNPDTASYIDRLRGIRHELAICGGFPCQDISSAGKGAGLSGERSGLFFEMARIISEIRPRYVFMENSPMLVSRGLHLVLSEIAAMGYDATWGVVGAHHAGGNHKRDRIWIVAHASGEGSQTNEHERISGGRSIYGTTEQQGADGSERMDDSGCSGLEGAHHNAEAPQGVHAVTCERRTNVANSMRERGKARRSDTQTGKERDPAKPYNEGCIERTDWWATEPDVGRVAHGVASRVDRLKAIGNGQVPSVAKIAWSIFDVN